jgi:SPP1 gp7 family putative phage head morphogenesis protein
MPSYLNIAIKRQVLLERLKSGQVKNFAKTIVDIEKLLRATMAGLEDDISKMKQGQFEKLISDLQKDQALIFQTGVDSFMKEQAEIAAFSMTQEILDLKSTVDMRGTKLNAFTKKDIFARVIQRPLNTDGDLLEPWIKDFTTKETKRVSNAIRLGRTLGRTNQELVSELIGTKAADYKNGILNITRRNASTVIRTSVQHVASAAQMEVWQANPRVVSRYRFLATLDGDTSAACRTLDGQEFDFGQGPIPPIHPNCRSRTIGVLNDKFKFITEGGTRSGKDTNGNANISAKETYYEWLKKQDQKTQDDVLGVQRAKLFRDGGMSAEKFRALQFDKSFEPLTLAQMRLIEPKAFEKAGLIPKSGQGAIDFKYPPLNPKATNTFDKHSKNGVFTPERQKLHNDILDDLFKGVTPVKKPVALMTGGGPASGKGSFSDAPKNYMKVDSDEIKKLIPEYKLGTEKKDSNAAAFSHEESSHISKLAMKRATENKQNFLLDGTGDSSIESLREKIASMRSNGHKVVANYVTVDTSEAVRRNIARAQKTGRMVPQAFVEETHKNISIIFPQALKEKLFDEVTLWDTNDRVNVKVMEYKDGKQTIFNQTLWERFLAKANPRPAIRPE